MITTSTCRHEAYVQRWTMHLRELEEHHQHS